MKLQNIVTFIIPFASKKFARNWQLSCNYLRQTVCSILNSEDPRLEIVIVGNEKPEDALPMDSRIVFIECAATSAACENHRDPSEIVKDQLFKMEKGWEYFCQKKNSLYVMRMDADDFISRKFVGYLAKHNEQPVYLISDGWVWSTGNKFFIWRTESFNLLCGSCLAFHSDVAGNKFDLTKIRPAIPDFIAKAKPSLDFLFIANELHSIVSNATELFRLEVSRIPFRAAVYRIGNINSFMQRKNQFHSLHFFLGQLRRTRFLSRSIMREFLIES